MRLTLSTYNKGDFKLKLSQKPSIYGLAYCPDGDVSLGYSNEKFVQIPDLLKADYVDFPLFHNIYHPKYWLEIRSSSSALDR